MNNRILKINSEIQKYISEIIHSELKNPNINGIISVVKVDTTNDLSISKVYLRIFNATDTQEVFNQILHSAGFIRKSLCSKLDIRKVPFLEFYLDDSIEYFEKIEGLIDKINDERREKWFLKKMC